MSLQLSLPNDPAPKLRVVSQAPEDEKKKRNYHNALLFFGFFVLYRKARSVHSYMRAQAPTAASLDFDVALVFGFVFDFDFAGSCFDFAGSGFGLAGADLIFAGCLLMVVLELDTMRVVLFRLPSVNISSEAGVRGGMHAPCALSLQRGPIPTGGAPDV